MTAAPPTTDVAAIRERCMNDWLRGRGKDLTQAETDRADMVSLYDELFEVYVAVTARAKAAEAKAARVEAVISTIKSTAPYAGWDARFVDRTLKALDAALMGTDRKL